MEVEKEEEPEGKLWERGLIGEGVLGGKGLLPKKEPRWEDEQSLSPGGSAEVPTNQKSRWFEGEAGAVKAYRAGNKEKCERMVVGPFRMSGFPRKLATPKDEPRHFSNRTIFIQGLPPNISYSELSRYIKTGPVDTIRIIEEENMAFVVFVWYKDSLAFSAFLKTAQARIRGYRITQSPIQHKYINGLRFREPVDISQRAMSRSIFLTGLPFGTTPRSLRRDMTNLIGAKLDFEMIEVQASSARVVATSVDIAVSLLDRLVGHPKYKTTVNYFERDPCDC
ncbi:hypothetical protein FN846DRAFT_924627 [Sphaerosporella brunnea]|uniref:RRM domain-containing protein n=1 Tax=Sphaerosporella brunnea TaxID=1250544 RepID=A0A5J5FBI2_9PEZI|nr:hypothetical protein FN846DRAFT_924627 [Sphaerosporella brunnea]